jgi:hypothetical protein
MYDGWQLLSGGRGVAVGVAVGVGVLVGVWVFVGVGDGVFVGDGEYVSVGVGVCVDVGEISAGTDDVRPSATVDLPSHPINRRSGISSRAALDMNIPCAYKRYMDIRPRLMILNNCPLSCNDCSA